MKKFLLSLIAMTFFVMSVFTQDIPPATSNLTNLPSGSYVIAMDNVLQSNGTTFNLYSYGLVTYLLNNNVRVRWVISSAKVKDDIDFSVTASRIKPTAAASELRDFRSGPFVIFAADLPANINTLIDAYNALSTTVTAVNVYQTTALATAVPVRYDYKTSGGGIWKPKAALMNDGGNWDIHRQYFYDAGIRFGQVVDNATNWSKSLGTNLISDCFTFASEAHWGVTNPNSTQQATMNAVRQFALDGGNILMECVAVKTYENFLKMHSTGGINAATVNDYSGYTANVYPNPALSYSQFQGHVDFNNGGSFKNWAYLGSLQNNEHDHAKAPSGLPAGNGSNNIGASVARIKISSPGGLVFYLGAHDYVSTTALVEVNGKRMYLNAFLTPNAICMPQAAPLPVTLKSFNASRNKSNVSLVWETSTESNNKGFQVQRKDGGGDFRTIAFVNTKAKAGNSESDLSYSFNDLNTLKGVSQYRLLQEDFDGKSKYSEIRSVMGEGQSFRTVVYPNPSTDGTVNVVFADTRSIRDIQLMDMNGRIVNQWKNLTNNNFKIDNLVPGFYNLRVVDQTTKEQSIEKIIIR